MNKREIVLLALAPAKYSIHSPVQVQKLFFLLDRNIANEINGPIFDFKPYNYGPFDRAVYDTLEELSKDGFVEIIRENNYRNYKLTLIGQTEGEKLLNDLPDYVKNFVIETSHFVRKLTFAQLVSAIYKAYPEMRANSVFQE